MIIPGVSAPIPGVDIVIFSGLLSGVLGFISSIVATILLYRTNKRQTRLLVDLQADKQLFGEKMQGLSEKASREIEKYKNDLDRRKAEFESQLKRREDFLNRQMQNLFLVVERSQDSTRSTVICFRSMLKKSRTMDAANFLPEFGRAIVMFNTFRESMKSLDNVVRPKDQQFLERAQKNFLEMLLGMRLEDERRLGQREFLDRVLLYEGKLRAMESVFGAKYRRILQPKSIGRPSA